MRNIITKTVVAASKALCIKWPLDLLEKNARNKLAQLDMQIEKIKQERKELARQKIQAGMKLIDAAMEVFPDMIIAKNKFPHTQELDARLRECNTLEEYTCLSQLVDEDIENIKTLAREHGLIGQ